MYRAAVLAAAVGACGAAAPAMADFAYQDFSSTSGLTLVGQATQTNNEIWLTQTAEKSSGAMWYTDAKQPVLGGFDTTFHFDLRNINGVGADGVAFVIQNASPTALGGAGGAMGYGTNNVYAGFGVPNSQGIPNSLAVEVDMWDNSIQNNWNDLDGYHVSIQSAGLLPNNPDQAFSLGAAPVSTSSRGALPGHTLRVQYTPDHTFNIFYDDMQVPLLSVDNIDLSQILQLDEGGSAWVGITSATGWVQDAQTHVATSWSFETVIPAPGAAALFGIGSIGLGFRRRRRVA